MSLENAQYIHQLNPANPSGADRLRDGDDHIRMTKAALKATFPNVRGPVTLDHEQLNALPQFAVPVGSILLWPAAAAPSGWAICDGSVVNRSDGTGTITTPDLRDRVPVGASGTNALGSRFGDKTKRVNTAAAGGHTHSAVTTEAGSHKHNVSVRGHALTVEQLPAHKHANGVTDKNDSLFNHGGLPASPGTATSIDGNGSAGTREGYTSSTGGGEAHGHGVDEQAAGAHTHPIEVEAVQGHQHAVEVDVTQPSIALNFIMKV